MEFRGSLTARPNLHFHLCPEWGREWLRQSGEQFGMANGAFSHARPLAAEEGRWAQKMTSVDSGSMVMLLHYGLRETQPEWKLDGAKVSSAPRVPCRARGGQEGGKGRQNAFLRM